VTSLQIIGQTLYVGGTFQNGAAVDGDVGAPASGAPSTFRQ
jgi:hypothetical protein